MTCPVSLMLNFHARYIHIYVLLQLRYLSTIYTVVQSCNCGFLKCWWKKRCISSYRNNIVHNASWQNKAVYPCAGSRYYNLKRICIAALLIPLCGPPPNVTIPQMVSCFCSRPLNTTRICFSISQISLTLHLATEEQTNVISGQVPLCD